VEHLATATGAVGALVVAKSLVGARYNPVAAALKLWMSSLRLRSIFIFSPVLYGFDLWFRW
jgi:hypothetical protein